MTEPTPNTQRQTELDMLEQVDNLSEEVKTLALNLALHLAKAKTEKNSAELNRLEPDFIRLVNGTVKTVAELTKILDAARNSETMAYDPPSGQAGRDFLETRLELILDQCSSLLGALARTKRLYRSEERQSRDGKV